MTGFFVVKEVMEMTNNEIVNSRINYYMSLKQITVAELSKRTNRRYYKKMKELKKMEYIHSNNKLSLYSFLYFNFLASYQLTLNLAILLLMNNNFNIISCLYISFNNTF